MFVCPLQTDGQKITHFKFFFTTNPHGSRFVLIEIQLFADFFSFYCLATLKEKTIKFFLLKPINVEILS